MLGKFTLSNACVAALPTLASHGQTQTKEFERERERESKAERAYSLCAHCWHGNSKSFLLRHFVWFANSFTRIHTQSHRHMDVSAAALDNFVEWSRSRTVK